MDGAVAYSGDEASGLSIVIPTWNGESVLGDQLQALVGQSDQLEVIISDNGSNDDTLAVARSFASRFELVIIDASASRGVSFARNLGAAAASHRAILFLDQDDVVEDNYVAAMRSALANNPVVAARMDPVKLNPGWRRHVRTLAQEHELPIGGWAYGSTLGIRKDLFDQIGGFDVRFQHGGEDVDLGIRLRQRGIPITYVPEAVLHYRFPSTIRRLYRQGYGYGFAHSRVERRHSIAVRDLDSMRTLVGPIRLLLLGPDRGRRGKGAFLLGRRVGLRAGRRDSPPGP